MAVRDIVVMGGSAGCAEALRSVLGALPHGLQLALFVTIHRRLSTWEVHSLLRAPSDLPLHEAHDGEPIIPGAAYVCPADRHLLLERGRVRVELSPAETLHRPSIDALFRSAAQAYGRRVIGVVLSGMLTDGTAGLWEVKKHGGVAIVQDPAEARFPAMPQSALDNVPVDFCLGADGIGRKLGELAAAAPPPAGAARPRVLIVEDERIVAKNLERRLAELGYEVSGSAATAEDALALAEGALPDVVLMDIHLAGTMPGTEAARRVWQRLQIPVVYLTAYSDAETLAEVKATAPYGYVVKPFRPDQLHAALQLALERRGRETEQG